MTSPAPPLGNSGARQLLVGERLPMPESHNRRFPAFRHAVFILVSKYSSTGQSANMGTKYLRLGLALTNFL